MDENSMRPVQKGSQRLYKCTDTGEKEGAMPKAEKNQIE
jgi:hypothetical protein